jgi:translation initiation factor IF-2
LIIAFDVRVEAEARRIAELNGVSIREYSVIYALIEDVDQLLSGMLEPRYEEVVHGHAEVRQIFKAGRRTIGGAFVTDGVVRRQDRIRLTRGGQQLWQGSIDSLKRFKDDVNEVREGFEFGIALDGWDDIEVGDTLEDYASERV